MRHNRTITILGAGAVLDFDFQNKTVPTTRNITKQLLNTTIQGLNSENVNLIQEVYNILFENARQAYLSFHPDVRHYEPNINFEELFDVIETLASYNGAWLKEDLSFPMVSSLVSPNVHFQSVEYVRALEAMINVILDIVNDYNSDFAKNEEKELWYRNFWKAFNGNNDVFTLNYDTTVENSLKDEYNDGFIPFVQQYQRFSPKFLMENESSMTTINHLHGCVLYADANPLNGQYEYSHRDLFKFKCQQDVFLSRQWMPTNQAKTHIFYSPIITGLKKTDKICYLPHSFYHSNLAMKILKNPSLLIVGYSFGDLYVNQFLERHKLIHNDKQRVVVIDKYPEYVNKDWTSLYQHFINRGSFQDFMLRLLEEANLLEAKDKIERINSNVWQDKQGRFRLYTGGFKDAVEKHGNDIIQFLDNNYLYDCKM